MGKLESAIGVAGGSVDKWEKDKSMPGGKALISLSNFFSVSIDWILKGEESPQVPVNEKVEMITTELSPEDVELLAKFHQLDLKDQGRIEERIEMLLADKRSSNSVTANP